VHEIIEAMPAENRFKWAIRDRLPLPQRTIGRVSLPGEAGHPKAPIPRPGRDHGNVRTERASAAASCDVDDALTRYETARKERANGVQIATRERAEVLMTFTDADSLLVRPPPAYDPTAVSV
jgi:salicylate hydroxylase